MIRECYPFTLLVEMEPVKVSFLRCFLLSRNRFTFVTAKDAPLSTWFERATRRTRKLFLLQSSVFSETWPTRPCSTKNLLISSKITQKEDVRLTQKVLMLVKWETEK